MEPTCAHESSYGKLVIGLIIKLFRGALNASVSASVRHSEYLLRYMIRKCQLIVTFRDHVTYEKIDVMRCTRYRVLCIGYSMVYS